MEDNLCWKTTLVKDAKFQLTNHTVGRTIIATLYDIIQQHIYADYENDLNTIPRYFLG